MTLFLLFSMQMQMQMQVKVLYFLLSSLPSIFLPFFTSLKKYQIILIFLSYFSCLQTMDFSFLKKNILRNLMLLFFVVSTSFCSYSNILVLSQNMENLKFFTFPDYINIPTLLLSISAVLGDLSSAQKTIGDILDSSLIENSNFDNMSNFTLIKYC